MAASRTPRPLMSPAFRRLMRPRGPLIRRAFGGPLPAARGDLLERLGRTEEAAYEFDRAAELTRNERERTLLAERARACRSGG
jgi:hypothetical protein